MRIAILGDLHLGAFKHDEWTEQNQRHFFTDFFFPKMKELGIKTVIQTGDFFDDRNSIKHPTIDLAHQIIDESRMEWHILVGNHDMHMRDRIHPNAVTEILGRHANVTVYDTPGTIDAGDCMIDMIPWICKENRQQIMDFVATTNSSVAVGHFELNGFKFYPNVTAKSGDDPNFLSVYDKVLSGHYHTASESANKKIVYIGTPYTLNFNDANDQRGFYVFDTTTQELEFFENPICHHIRFTFDADTYEPTDDTGSKLQKAWIECITPDNKKRKIKFTDILEKWAPEFYDIRVDYTADLKGITESISEMEDSELSDKSSIQYVNEYVESLGVDEDVQTRLLSIVQSLYNEAQDEMAGNLV